METLSICSGLGGAEVRKLKEEREQKGKRRRTGWMLQMSHIREEVLYLANTSPMSAGG